MSSETRDWELLLHRHLEGTLQDGEAAELAERLKTDSALARRLAEMSVDVVQLRDLGTATGVVEDGEPAGVVIPKPTWPKGSLAAAAAILLATAIAIVSWSVQGPGESPAPAGDPGDLTFEESVREFEGTVAGTFVQRDEEPLRFRVDKIIGETGGSARPATLNGRTIRLRAPGRVETAFFKAAQAYLHKVRHGQKDVHEIRHVKEDIFEIVRLTDIQKVFSGFRERDREGNREEDGGRKREKGDRPRRDGDREGDERNNREDGERLEQGERPSRETREYGVREERRRPR